MAFQYPPKPWVDGQTFSQIATDGSTITGVYDSGKNAWTLSRSTSGGVVPGGVVTTVDVQTVNQRPDVKDVTPFELNPGNISNQQDVNWWLYDRYIELEEQVDNITVTKDRGLWRYSDGPILDGVFNQFDVNDEHEQTFTDVVKVVIATRDSSNTDHSFADVQIGDLIEIKADIGDDFGLLKIINIASTGSQIELEVEHDRSSGYIEYNSLARIKIFTRIDDPDRPPIISADPPTTHPQFPTSGLEVGDFWIDSNNIMHYWTGSEWQEILDSNHYQDEYVKKTGDIMTGPLVMNAAERILMRDSDLDFVRLGESLKDANGDPILEDDGQGNMVEQWDDSIDRFSHIESVAPILLKSDDTFGTDLSAPFGIRVEIDDGNTYRNRFAVGNRWGDAVTITGGTGPNVQFGTGFEGNQNPPNGRIDWADGEEGGVKIIGIPTPTFENPESRLAVNKNYVDTRDEILRQNIIELEEEIDAIAPSVERGVWTFNLGGFANNPGQLTMTDGQNQSGSPIGLFKNVQSVWLNEIDNSGTTHGFDNVIPGDLIELFVEGDPDYGLYTVVEAHDKTGGGNNYWVIDVDFVRTLNDTSTVNAGQNIRVKIFKAPTGGDASEFVLKSGDTMTGTLQMGKVTANTPNSTASPKIKFEGKTATGSTNNAELYYLGSSNYLYTNNNFYASGTVQSHSYGGFGYAGDTRMGFGSKTVDGVSSTKYGYLGIGSSSNTRAMEWSGSKGLQWLKAGTSGSQGQVLKKSRASGSNESRPVWQGVVDISPSGSNRCVGELWYNSNDQVLYVRIS